MGFPAYIQTDICSENEAFFIFTMMVFRFFEKMTDGTSINLSYGEG